MAKKTTTPTASQVKKITEQVVNEAIKTGKPVDEVAIAKEVMRRMTGGDTIKFPSPPPDLKVVRPEAEQPTLKTVRFPSEVEPAGPAPFKPTGRAKPGKASPSTKPKLAPLPTFKIEPKELPTLVELAAKEANVPGDLVKSNPGWFRDTWSKMGGGKKTLVAAGLLALANVVQAYTRRSIAGDQESSIADYMVGGSFLGGGKPDPQLTPEQMLNLNLAGDEGLQNLTIGVPTEAAKVFMQNGDQLAGDEVAARMAPLAFAKSQANLYSMSEVPIVNTLLPAARAQAAQADQNLEQLRAAAFTGV